MVALGRNEGNKYISCLYLVGGFSLKQSDAMNASRKKSATECSEVNALPSAAAPLGGARFLTAKQVMPLLSYSDCSGFWQAVKGAGIPFIRINARRCLFEESAVRAWLDSRTVGKVGAA